MGGKVSDQLRSSDGYHDALKEHRRRFYGELSPEEELSSGGELSPVERKEALKSSSSDVNNDS